MNRREFGRKLAVVAAIASAGPMAVAKAFSPESKIFIGVDPAHADSGKWQIVMYDLEGKVLVRAQGADVNLRPNLSCVEFMDVVHVTADRTGTIERLVIESDDGIFTLDAPIDMIQIDNTHVMAGQTVRFDRCSLKTLLR